MVASLCFDLCANVAYLFDKYNLSGIQSDHHEYKFISFYVVFFSFVLFCIVLHWIRWLIVLIFRRNRSKSAGNQKYKWFPSKLNYCNKIILFLVIMYFEMQLNWTGEKHGRADISCVFLCKCRNFSTDINKHSRFLHLLLSKLFACMAFKPIRRHFIMPPQCHDTKKKNTKAITRTERKKLNKLPLFHRAVNRFVCATRCTFTNYAKSF